MSKKLLFYFSSCRKVDEFRKSCRILAFFTCLHLKLVLLRFLTARFVCIFLSLAILASSVNRINRAFICTFLAGIWITDSVVLHLEKRAMWYRWPHGQACNTKLALVIRPVRESIHSHSSINQFNLADFSFES